MQLCAEPRAFALGFGPRTLFEKCFPPLFRAGVEGYPGLVVHGPYAQQCLLNLARDHNPGRTLASFTMRARAPLFDTAPFGVVGRLSGDKSCEVWTVTPEGIVAASATATFA